MGTRLKGQEVSMLIVVDGKQNEKIGPFLDLDVTLMKEIVEADYLGETTTYFDSVFKGCSLTAKGHLRGASWLKLVDQDIRRARYQPNALVRVDLSAVIIFPGLVLPWTFKDLTFGDHKFTFADRKSFVEASLDARCSEQPTLPANIG